MNEKINEELNHQLNKEYYSSYLYFSMSAFFERKGLPGFANWMRVQSQEEHAHAAKIYHFVIERGGTVILQSIDAPPHDWENTKSVLLETLKHEQFITESINNLLDLSMKLRDHPTTSFLQWYVNEQVEEESSVKAVIDRLEIAKDDGNALLLIDKELSARVFVDPMTENGGKK